jgi:virulence-associated protein VapD
MAFYVVTYDLKKKAESEYQDLWDELDSMDSIKTQKSVYLVSSARTQKEVLEALRPHIQEDDFVMVVTFSRKPSYTKALKGTNAWITLHFPD